MSRKALGRGLSALFPETSSEPGLLHLQIDLLDPSPGQPRTSFKPDALDELAASIKARGIIQPLVVRRRGERFEIVAGERRWRAAERAGLQKVPCLVKDIPDDSVLEFSLIENIQRQELNAIEEANAYRRLVNELGITQEEVARRVGKDRSSITNSLRLLRLTREVQSLVEEEKLSMGHARALIPIDQPEIQQALARAILSKGLSVRASELLVRRTLSPEPALPKGADKTDPENANVKAAESKLSRRLGTPVRIRGGKRGGVIEIRYSSADELSRLFDVLLRAAREQ
jgi:ParB family chromosome partitioning protein